MKYWSYSRLSDAALLQLFTGLVDQERAAIATLLAVLAEIDARKLYLPAAYPSMYLYCVNEHHMSEDTALKRIRAARAAHRFPGILDALADGRLNLSGVTLLAPHLTPENVGELLQAAARKTNAQIELLLAERFPRQDLPAMLAAVLAPAGPSETGAQLAVRPVVPSDSPEIVASMEPVAPPVGHRAKLAPLAPGRFALQVTLDQGTHDALRRAQALLGHSVPSGDVATVLKRALEALVEKLQKQKFAATDKPRARRGAAKGRHIPAAIRRAVWERDGGRCTFTSAQGRRCESRTRLEFDHVEPVARGGETSVNQLRLRCRAHNQHAAECAFGADFMRGKREQAGERAASARAIVPREGAAAVPEALDVTPWLRQLGFTAREASDAAASCAHVIDASLGERVKLALRGAGQRCVRRPGAG